MAKIQNRKKLEKRLAYITTQLAELDKDRSDKTKVKDADHTTWAKLLREKHDLVSQLRDA